MDIRKSSLRAAAAIAVWALWLAWHWQPVRQVRLHQESFLAAVGDRNWQKVAGLMDEQYTDRWVHDKPSALSAVHEVFSQFLTVRIQAEGAIGTAENGKGQYQGVLRMQGQGSPIAQMVIDRVNALHERFTFHWIQRSWKPWDWALVSIEQPELQVDHLDF